MANLDSGKTGDQNRSKSVGPEFNEDEKERTSKACLTKIFCVTASTSTM